MRPRLTQKDFTELRAHGHVGVSRPLLISYLPGPGELIVGYKIRTVIGKAVARNRIRRRLGGALQDIAREDEFAGLGGRLVINVRSADIKDMDYQEVLQHLRYTFTKAINKATGKVE